MSLSERQETAGVIGCVLLFGVPAVVCTVLGFVSIWVLVLGGHPQAMLWGWLSSTHVDNHGNTVYEPNNVGLVYGFAIVNIYLFYQFCELINASYRALYRAMT